MRFLWIQKLIRRFQISTDKQGTSYSQVSSIALVLGVGGAICAALVGWMYVALHESEGNLPVITHLAFILISGLCAMLSASCFDRTKNCKLIISHDKLTGFCCYSHKRETILLSEVNKITFDTLGSLSHLEIDAQHDGKNVHIEIILGLPTAIEIATQIGVPLLCQERDFKDNFSEYKCCWIDILNEGRVIKVPLGVPHEVVGFQITHKVSRMGGCRMYRDINTKEFADILGLSEQALAELETQGIVLPRQMLEELAEKLFVKPEYLIEDLYPDLGIQGEHADFRERVKYEKELTEADVMAQPSKYWLVRIFSSQARFPHWSLRWIFWVAIVLVPVPSILSVAYGVFYPKTAFWLGIYFLSIVAFLAGVSAITSVRHNRRIFGVKKDEPYDQRYWSAIGGSIPIGAFFVYFTYYLCAIPFGHEPNYVFTLKPSKQLEMELNDLLGADTLEYTPFDYSLDTQEVTYVTDGVNYDYIGMLGNFVSRREKYVDLDKADLDYVFSIRKKEPFSLTIIDKKCFFTADVENFEPRVINNSAFKIPIVITKGIDGEMLVGTQGAYYPRWDGCRNSDPRSPIKWDPKKYLALQAYIQYPAIYFGVMDYKKVLRRKYDFTLEHFDSRISSF